MIFPLNHCGGANGGELLLRNNFLWSRGMYSPISRLKIAFILLILAESLLRIGGSREGVKGVAPQPPPPFKFQKQKRVIKQSKK